MPGFGRGRSRDRGRRGTPGLERKPPHRRWVCVSPYVLGEREATRAENAARVQKNARGVCRKQGRVLVGLYQMQMQLTACIFLILSFKQACLRPSRVNVLNIVLPLALVSIDRLRTKWIVATHHTPNPSHTHGCAIHFLWVWRFSVRCFRV